MMVTVTLGKVPLKTADGTPMPHSCPMCGIKHHFKTLHLQLEGDGTCLVSDGVLEYLGQNGTITLTTPGAIAANDPIFDYIGVFDDPPAIGLGLGNADPEAPAPKTIPRLHFDVDVDDMEQYAQRGT